MCAPINYELINSDMLELIDLDHDMPELIDINEHPELDDNFQDYEFIYNNTLEDNIITYIELYNYTQEIANDIPEIDN